MLKTKDLYLKKIYNLNGKYIGVVEDIALDFHNSKLIGFKISNHGLFKNDSYINMDNIIEFSKDIIVTRVEEEKKDCVLFKHMRGMEVVDFFCELKGIVEDIIIDKLDYTIVGLVISSGIIDKLINGKDILLINNCILGEEYVLYTGHNSIIFKTLPHNLEKRHEFKKL